MLRLLAILLSALTLVAALVACSEDSGETPTPQPGLAETVDFQTSDGITLRGHLFGDGDTVVILAHMRPSDQSSWYDFAQELAEQGYSALTFDFRGFGESDGDKEFSKIDLDVEAAIEAMRARGHDNIFLIGASMGGTASIVVAAREEVSGVVTLSAPARFEGLDAEEAVAQVTEPKLFFASKDDPSAKSSLEELFKRAPDPKIQKVFNGDAHGTDMLTENEERAAELKSLVMDFLAAP